MADKKNRKWPDLKEAANRLGVSYGYLRLVLLGKSSSPALLARYQAEHDEAGRLLKELPSDPKSKKTRKTP